METMKQSGLWSSLGTHGSVVVIWWLCISSSRDTFSIKFYLEGQGQLHPHPQPPPQKTPKKTKTIVILTKLFPPLIQIWWS